MADYYNEGRRDALQNASPGRFDRDYLRGYSQGLTERNPLFTWLEEKGFIDGYLNREISDSPSYHVGRALRFRTTPPSSLERKVVMSQTTAGTRIDHEADAVYHNQFEPTLYGETIRVQTSEMSDQHGYDHRYIKL